MPAPTTPQKALEDAVAYVQSAGQLRTWSIIVSVFGDAVLQRGAMIRASTLQAILRPLSIEPGAMRTALSRLAKDGWIESKRSGRTSAYRLSASALAQTDLASKVIYAARRPVSKARPSLIVWPDQAEVPTDPALIMMRRGVALWPAGPIPEQLTSNALTAGPVTGPIPEWVRTALASPSMVAQFSALKTGFGSLETSLERGDQMAPPDAAAARVLLIHAWRRLALRLTGLPDDFMPADWPEPECRRFVLRLHAGLSKVADPWLDAYVSKGIDNDPMICHKNDAVI